MNMKYAMRSEDTEQINVISWASWQMQKYPELKWLHHIPNGGSRNRAEAVKLEADGREVRRVGLMSSVPKRNILRTVHRNEV